MTNKQLEQIFKDTDFVHRSGTDEELKVAEYLKSKCEELGAQAHLEDFDVAMSKINDAHLFADGKEIPCKACFCCGSGEIEGDFFYLTDYSPVMLALAKDKIVLVDTGIDHFTYQDIVKAGVKGIIFRYGNANYPNNDIDQRDLRSYVVGDSAKLLCAIINVKDAIKLVKSNTKRIKLTINQDEYTGKSHNVVAELPGIKDEFITLSAHYDTTALSHGAYDNMTGCAGLLGVIDKFSKKKLNYGLRFVFCGSEERGLLGSKAYVASHESELDKIALNINLDMIGTIMGKFIARVSAEDKLTNYIGYMAAETGFSVTAKTGVYSSDSTPFADKGVPALSFARIAGGDVAPIHCRYDLKTVLSMQQLQKDIDFICQFTYRMANSVVCPVSRDIPESVKKELDEYLARKRKN